MCWQCYCVNLWWLSRVSVLHNCQFLLFFMGFRILCSTSCARKITRSYTMNIFFNLYIIYIIHLLKNNPQMLWVSIVISLPAPLWRCSPSASVPLCIICGWLCIMVKGFCRGEVARCTPMHVARSWKLHPPVSCTPVCMARWRCCNAAWEQEQTEGVFRLYVPSFPGLGLSFMLPADPGSQCPALLIVHPCSFPALPGPWLSLPMKARCVVSVNFSVLKFRIAKHFNW